MITRTASSSLDSTSTIPTPNPNAQSFAELLRKIDLEENIDCARSYRTIMRDIEVLEKDFHAPIEYDAARRGYYLTRPWDFEVPVFGDEIISMTLLGTKLATDILPEPVKGLLEGWRPPVAENFGAFYADFAFSGRGLPFSTGLL